MTADEFSALSNTAGNIIDANLTANQQIAQLEAEISQLNSDASSSRVNVDIIQKKIEALNKLETEQIGNIKEKGQSVFGERTALTAAEGFSGGGTARSVTSQIRRKVNKDIITARDNYENKRNIFELQKQQQLDQATAYDTQKTFATNQQEDINNAQIGGGIGAVAGGLLGLLGGPLGVAAGAGIGYKLGEWVSSWF